MARPWRKLSPERGVKYPQVRLATDFLPVHKESMNREEVQLLLHRIKDGVAKRGFFILFENDGLETLVPDSQKRATAEVSLRDFATKHGWVVSTVAPDGVMFRDRPVPPPRKS